jgi:ubiquitin-protein ligase
MEAFDQDAARCVSVSELRINQPGRTRCRDMAGWRPDSAEYRLLNPPVFLALYDLIQTPNPDDPLVSSIVRYASERIYARLSLNLKLMISQADQYRQDRPSFDKKVAEYTRQVSFWHLFSSS